MKEEPKRTDNWMWKLALTNIFLGVILSSKIQCYHGNILFNIFLGEQKPRTAGATGPGQPEPAPVLERVQPAGHASQPTLLPSSALEVWLDCTLCLSWFTNLCNAAGSVNSTLTPLVSIWSLFNTPATAVRSSSSESSRQPYSLFSWVACSFPVFIRIWPFIS